MLAPSIEQDETFEPDSLCVHLNVAVFDESEVSVSTTLKDTLASLDKLRIKDDKTSVMH